MCMKCGCGYADGAWKYDMQPMTFDGGMPANGSPIDVQPSVPYVEYDED